MQQTNMAQSAYKMNTNGPKMTVRSDVKETRSEVFGPGPVTDSIPGSGNFPEKKFRAGAVSVTVWHNKAQKMYGTEGEYMTVSLDMSYTDKEGKWQSTHSLRTNDLPRAIIALQKAFEHIVLQEQDLLKGGN